MNFILGTYILLVAMVGAAVGSFKVCAYLGAGKEIAFGVAVTLTTFTFAFCWYWIIESPRDDARSTALAFWGWLVVLYLMRGKKCRRIRNDIRVFLSDREPTDRIVYPYYCRNSTYLAQAIEKIWEQELKARTDEILLLTDINR